MVAEQLHPDGYQRYNDDSLLISDSREFLEYCYMIIKEKYRKKSKICSHRYGKGHTKAGSQDVEKRKSQAEETQTLNGRW